MLPLTSERLVIREFSEDDLDGLHTVYGDPAVLWWQEAPSTREQTARALAHILELYRSNGMAQYAVVLRSSDEIIGTCGPVCREVEAEYVPELGWDIRSDLWGRGYATEAARGVLTHCADLGLRRVYSLIVPENERSRGVARNLGMTIERQVMWEGRPHDLWALGLCS